MQFSWPTFLLAVALGIVQLGVGVLFGRALALGGSRSGRGHRRSAKRLRRFGRRLFALVTSVAEDVDQSQSQIQQINDELASLQPDERDHLTELVLKSVARIMQINERLQTRLAAAEKKLIEQAKQIEDQLAEARTDALTGLPNRRAFDDELQRRLAEWQRTTNTFCLMMIDIDHFKILNDRHGHPAGDQALCNLAELLDSTLREMDLTARVGGEEFAAILPSTNLSDGCRASERVRTAVASQRFRFESTELRLTVSIGLAAVDSGDNVASLIKRADAALYAAKRAGRNCGYFHNGRACEWIDRARFPEAGRRSSGNRADRPPDGEAPEADELALIGSDLRKRLAEVTGETRE
jgi:diguanylate cyclase